MSSRYVTQDFKLVRLSFFLSFFFLCFFVEFFSSAFHLVQKERCRTRLFPLMPRVLGALRRAGYSRTTTAMRRRVFWHNVSAISQTETIRTSRHHLHPPSSRAAIARIPRNQSWGHCLRRGSVASCALQRSRARCRDRQGAWCRTQRTADVHRQRCRATCHSPAVPARVLMEVVNLVHSRPDVGIAVSRKSNESLRTPVIALCKPRIVIGAAVLANLRPEFTTSCVVSFIDIRTFPGRRRVAPPRKKCPQTRRSSLTTALASPGCRHRNRA
ncbi:hypothetical protein DFH06DRAFT_1228714, partial [Mycena polygramma]